MARALRVAVAEDDAAMELWFQKALPQAGHEVLFVAHTGEELVSRCRLSPPDLIIADIKLEGVDGITACEQVYRERPVPIVLVSAYFEDEFIQRAENSHVMSYLLKPIEPEDLRPTLALAVKRFEQVRSLGKEAADLRQSLADRKVIERAKGLIMKRARVDEPEAFRRLQKMSSDKNIKLAEVARNIVDAEKVFENDEPRPQNRS